MRDRRAIVNCILAALFFGDVFAVPMGVPTAPGEETTVASATPAVTECPCKASTTPVTPAGNGTSPLGGRILPFGAGSSGSGPSTGLHTLLVHGMMCMCNVLQTVTPRDDYRHTPGIGSHKLHTRSSTWNVARKLCNEEGGHLAIVNSILEANILLDIFNNSGPIKDAAYPDVALLGIHDLYEEGEWVTVLGESIARTGYTGWSDKWGGQPDNGSGRQNCGALLKEGGLDDVACDVPFPFFCEIPLIQLQ